MDNLNAKVAYLKGLCEGLKIDESKPEGMLISKIIETLADFAEVVEDVCAAHDELQEYVEDIDDDLTEIEELAFDDDGCNCGCGCGSDCDCGCHCHDDDEDDMDCFEIQCPNCKEDVMVDFDSLEDDEPIICPNCHQEIELEFDCDCDDDCDCGCEHDED